MFAVADRLLFVWLYRLFPSVLNAIAVVQPETIIRWHREGFRLLLAVEVARSGGPKVPVETVGFRLLFVLVICGTSGGARISLSATDHPTD